MTRASSILLTLIGVGGLWFGHGAASAQVTSGDRLSVELTRAARGILESDPLTALEIDAALILVEETLALRPDDPDQWRLMLKLAALADRRDLQDTALRRILELDPDDESARLLRLSAAIDQFQTIEQRVAAYERLLAPDHRDRIGTAVSSRLALDLALLHQRNGDREAFGRWLAEAAVIDPSNRQAAALIAGFFSTSSDDHYAQAELLCNLFMADPTDLNAQGELARLLLNAGAYRAADRIYQVLTAGLAAENIPIEDDLLADLAAVTWARGDGPGAITLILRRFESNDEAFAAQAPFDAPPDPNTPAQLQAPKSTRLALTVAAILSRLDDDGAAGAVQMARDAYAWELAHLELAPDTETIRAQLLLELSWLSLWLADDPEAARAALASADALQPLNDEARQRFEGWFALQAGDPDEAIARLGPLAGEDPAAELGLAHAHLASSQTREAARHFLAVARARPGTLMGVWAEDHLVELLGRRLMISDLSRQLDELIESLPAALDRYAQHSTTAVSFRLRPVERTCQPFDPVLIDVEISNQSILPLAVNPQGPIRPQIIIFPSVNFMRHEVLAPPAPIVVDIDRVLRLEPGQHETIRIDLRHYDLGAMLNDHPLEGASISQFGIINFFARSNGVLEPGLLGSTTSPPFVRVNGVRISEEWLLPVIAQAQGAMPLDPATLALLCHVVAEPVPENASASSRNLVDDAAAAVLRVFPKLDEVTTAWMLTVLPAHETFEPLLNMTRKSEHRQVKLAYLLFQRTGDDDPMLDAAMRGDDEAIRVVAGMIRDRAERAAAVRPDANPAPGGDTP